MTTRLTLASPEIPGAAPDHPIVLIGAVIHPVSGPELSPGMLVIDQGRITAIGAMVEIPENARTIDLKGKHVYPGLIESMSDLGLTEIRSVRATLDTTETGELNPNVRAQVAVNPDSELIPVARSNGVLLALAAPTGGVLSGTSALIQLDGWTWEDMTVKAPVGLHVEWPMAVAPQSSRLRTATAPPSDRHDKVLENLRQVLADARAYRTARQAAVDAARRPATDARWEAMAAVLDGGVPLFVRADEIHQIQEAVQFADREGLKLVIIGGYDAPHCADLLRQANVPVIVGGINRLPQRRDDPYDAAFTVPAQLHAAGVKFCISGLDEGSNVRNLPYHAAMAAAFGLPADVALRSITLSAAEILGVADRLGSLDVGKDATLFVTNGDPLEIPTLVEMAFVQGREVELSDRHKRLWNKYKEKYRRQGIEQ